MMSSLYDHIEQSKKQRKSDAETFDTHDDDLCMMCHAYGADKRTLLISCFYDIHEVVPEALDTHEIKYFADGGYYIRICKSCRGRFLGMLRSWRADCVALRILPKDHDGDDLDKDIRVGLVPVRKDGTIIWKTPEEVLASKEEAE